jgi:hypothetical protein
MCLNARKDRFADSVTGTGSACADLSEILYKRSSQTHLLAARADALR